MHDFEMWLRTTMAFISGSIAVIGILRTPPGGDFITYVFKKSNMATKDDIKNVELAIKGNNKEIIMQKKDIEELYDLHEDVNVRLVVVETTLNGIKPKYDKGDK